MSIKQLIVALTASLTLSCAACAAPLSQHSSAASEHTAMAAVHSTGALLKGAASVAAVPLLVVGSAGVAVGSAGAAIADFASEPLPLGGETIEEKRSGVTPDPATVLGNP